LLSMHLVNDVLIDDPAIPSPSALQTDVLIVTIR
jgi:hypothetical protein